MNKTAVFLISALFLAPTSFASGGKLAKAKAEKPGGPLRKMARSNSVPSAAPADKKSAFETTAVWGKAASPSFEFVDSTAVWGSRAIWAYPEIRGFPFSWTLGSDHLFENV